MSLAFALMAAINGSTGSSATLSHGLQQPHERNEEDRCRRSDRLMRCCIGDGGRPVGRVALRSRPAGGGCKPPRGAPVKSRGAERCGKGVP